MASFTDLVRAQRQSGKSAATSLSGAYNQLNMQRFDPRNALFSQTGLMTALFPSLKGYQASPISKKSPTSMISPEVSGSPTALSSIARDARISARNSMALPSIARNMAQLVRLSGGTPTKYFEGAKEKEEKYESKFGGGKKGSTGLGKTSGAGGFNILSMLGGLGSIAGSLLGGAASAVGSILGGIGGLLGGAVSGVFGVLKGALGGMGFIGILAAGALGLLIYQLYQSLDFSGLKKNINNFTDELTKGLDSLTDGEFSKTMKELREGFKTFSLQVTSIVETTMELMSKLVIATVRDIMGKIENFYEDIRFQITGQSRETKVGPGGMNVSEMSLTSGRSLEELESKKQQALEMRGEYSFFRRGLKIDPKTGKSEWQDQDMRVKWNRVLDKLDENISYVKGKDLSQKQRTSNVSETVENMSFSQRYEEKLGANKWRDWYSSSQSPTPAKSESGKVTFNSLTKEQQNAILDMQFKQEGNKKGELAYDLNNPGALIYGPFAAKYGAIPNTTRGTLKDSKGNLVPFAQFPTFEAGRNAQRDLWKTKYGDMSLDDALRKWVAPRNAAEEAQLSKYTAGIYGTLGMPAAESRTAKAETPTKTPSQAAPMAGGTSMSDSVASLAYDQITALDKLMGGKLMEGSTVLADMLRDVTREFMNNPTFVDSSQTVNNTMPPGLASAVGSAYNPDATNLLVDRATS